MFYETKANILNESLAKTGEAFLDLQAYDSTAAFEDGIAFDLSHRAFCDVHTAINDLCYLQMNTKLYKVLHIKRWADYLELWLYECEVTG